MKSENLKNLKSEYETSKTHKLSKQNHKLSKEEKLKFEQFYNEKRNVVLELDEANCSLKANNEALSLFEVFLTEE